MSQTPPPIPVQAPKKRNWGCLIAAILVVLVFFGVGLFFLSTLAAIGGRLAGGDHKFPETVYTGKAWADQKVAIVRVEGVIASGGKDSMSETVIGMLRQARADEKVKAVVVRVNSPGGGVTASDEIYHEMNKLRKAGKPVVVYMETLAASGGYYIACAADEVIANETTLTGSIGVIIASYKIKGLLEKVGVEPQVFKSGDFKDMLSPTRDMRSDEADYVQRMVMESYEKFLGIVSDARKIPKDRLRDGIADGRIISGLRACELGLVDKNGYLEDAIAAACSRAGGGEFSVVEYESFPRLGDLIGFGGKSSGKIEVNLRAGLVPELRPGVPYLLPLELSGAWEGE